MGPCWTSKCCSAFLFFFWGGGGGGTNRAHILKPPPMSRLLATKLSDSSFIGFRARVYITLHPGLTGFLVSWSQHARVPRARLGIVLRFVMLRTCHESLDGTWAVINSNTCEVSRLRESAITFKQGLLTSKCGQRFRV